MSEQPNNTYDINHYRQSRANGELEMGPETDVVFHASALPLKRPVVEAVRELTEQEKTSEEIRAVAAKLPVLIEARARKLAA